MPRDEPIAEAPRTLNMFDDNPPDTEGETSSDSYCTPPEVMECVHASVNGCSVEGLAVRARIGPPIPIALDPCTNHRAISHGWVRAAESWTIEDGHHPDRDIDPRPWPIKAGDYVHANFPYSRKSKPREHVARFLFEIQRAQAWGGLLVKTDNRTGWWRDVEEHSPFLVLWDGPVEFFHCGVREKGNFFASSILVVDHTGMDRTQRYDQLSRAYEGKAWVR